MVKTIATAVNGNNTISTWLVDPNSEKQNAEDRYLYANLTAFPKSKSLIINQNSSGDIRGSNSDFDKPVSFITTSEINGKEYITTNYVEVDNVKSNSEGFGIKSINIDIKSNFVPIVKIEFFDVKGNSFVNFDNLGTASIDNPLSVFFRMPYPVFELTVKGFYGKAVTYCLHLLKWNANFDSSSGGFVITADFVGYTYAYLADVPLKHITASSHSLNFKDKLPTDSLPMYEFFEKLAKLTFIKTDFENNNNVFKKLEEYNGAIEVLNEIEKIVGTYNKNYDDIYGDDINFSNIRKEDYSNLNNLIVMSLYKLQDVNNEITKIKKLVKDFNTYANLTLNEPLIIKTDAGIVLDVNDIDFTDVRRKLKEKNVQYDVNSLTLKQMFGQDTNNLSPIENRSIFLFDLEYIKKTVGEFKNILIKNSEKYKKESLDILNTEFANQIGFKPTIGKVFKTICDNSDAYMSMIYDNAYEASDTSYKQKRLNAVGGYSKLKTIYPYPDVIDDDNKKKWLGSVINDVTPFPEVIFIENLITNIVTTENQLQDTIEEYEQDFGIQNNLKSYLPVSLLDANNDAYLNIHKENLIDFYNGKISNEILSRLVLIYSQNSFLSENQLIDRAGSEGILFNERNVKEDIVNLITSDNDFSDKMINIIDGKNYIPFLREYNYENGRNVIADIIEPELFESLINISTNYSVQNNDYILDKKIVEKSVLKIHDTTHHYEYKGYHQIDLFLESFTNYESIFTKITNSYENKFNDKYKQNQKYKGEIEQSITTLGDIFGYTNTTKDEYNINFEVIENISTLDDLFTLLYNSTVLENILPFYIEKANYVVKMPYFYFLSYQGDANKSLVPTELVEVTEEILNHYNDNQKNYITEQYRILISLLDKYGYNNYNSIKTNFTDNKAYLKAQGELVKFFKKTVNLGLINTYANDNTNLINNDILKKMLERFKSQIVKVNSKTNTVKNETSYETLLEDDDYKIATYETVKSLYDKWISYGQNNGKIHNACLSNEYSLYEHFHFVDRTWKDISEDLIINPNIILGLTENPKISLYSFISRILNDSNFLVFFAPSFISYKSISDVENMFKTNLYQNKASGFPSIIAMYIGGNSKNLDIKFEDNENDGFDFFSQSIPKGFSNRTISKNVIDENAYNVCAFSVNITDQEQEHFIEANVGQEEHRDTSESLMALSQIFDKGGANKRLLKGADLYNMYINRSYTSNIKAMGNMQIQPMGYYQLNIPFFNGAYLITGVNHNIVPHMHYTTFTGVRVPKFVYPIMDELTSFIKLDLKSRKSFSTQRLNSSIRDGSNGYDIDCKSGRNPELAEQPLSNNILINTNKSTQFYAVEGLTRSQFDQNLNRIFNRNIIDKYNLKGDVCMRWVKYALADLGFVAKPWCAGNHAWTFFANISDDSNMEFFDDPQLVSSKNMYKYISEDMAIVFGYFESSDWIDESKAEIRDFASSEIKSELGQGDNDLVETPITHIGLFYDKICYDFAMGMVRQNHGGTFKPVAYYPLDDKLDNFFS